MDDGLSESKVFDAVWGIVTRRLAERTSAAVDLVSDVLEGYGQLHRREQELVAGERVLNEDHQILPRVARATGLGLCLYLGNRRIASVSVLEAGDALETGGYADATIVETVLRRRETFRGEVQRGGRTHLIACRPLFASSSYDDHGPIGIIEAFQDQESLRETVATTLREHGGGEYQTTEDERQTRSEAVIHFIDDVARRLQLLALNGNIIAAQAGDHGRAFRVVCRELSSLADQSKDTVAEVRSLAREFGPAQRTQSSAPSLPDPRETPEPAPAEAPSDAAAETPEVAT